MPSTSKVFSIALWCMASIGCARSEPVTTSAPEALTHPAESDFKPIRVEAAAPGLAPDGYPTGQDTAEGAACDLARSFINPNPELFRKTCYPRSRAQREDQYNDFLDEMVADMEKVKGMPIEQAGGPKSISRVFRARHLSANGPGSFGYAVLRLIKVQFVDVDTLLWNGGKYTNRTLVVQSEDSEKWFVIPRPDLFEDLSQGLDRETDSRELWTPAAK